MVKYSHNWRWSENFRGSYKGFYKKKKYTVFPSVSGPHVISDFFLKFLQFAFEKKDFVTQLNLFIHRT